MPVDIAKYLFMEDSEFVDDDTNLPNAKTAEEKRAIVAQAKRIGMKTFKADEYYKAAKAAAMAAGKEEAQIAAGAALGMLGDLKAFTKLAESSTFGEFSLNYADQNSGATAGMGFSAADPVMEVIGEAVGQTQSGVANYFESEHEDLTSEPLNSLAVKMKEYDNQACEYPLVVSSTRTEPTAKHRKDLPARIKELCHQVDQLSYAFTDVENNKKSNAKFKCCDDATAALATLAWFQRKAEKVQGIYDLVLADLYSSRIAIKKRAIEFDRIGTNSN